jgi:hypothetical protein
MAGIISQFAAFLAVMASPHVTDLQLRIHSSVGSHVLTWWRKKYAKGVRAQYTAKSAPGVHMIRAQPAAAVGFAVVTVLF